MTVNKGVRQGCIVSPFLLNAFMDEVMKELKMGRVGGEKDIKKRGESGKCLTSRMTCFV